MDVRQKDMQEKQCRPIGRVNRVNKLYELLRPFYGTFEVNIFPQPFMQARSIPCILRHRLIHGCKVHPVMGYRGEMCSPSMRGEQMKIDYRKVSEE